MHPPPMYRGGHLVDGLLLSDLDVHIGVVAEHFRQLHKCVELV